MAFCNKYKRVRSYNYLVTSHNSTMESVKAFLNGFEVQMMPGECACLYGGRGEAFQMAFLWSHELEDNVEVIIVEKGSSEITFSLHEIKAAENLQLLVY